MRSWEWNDWYNLSFCDAQHMFQPLIEFVSLNPEFAMLTTGPPYFSLQSSEMLILPYAILIFLLNRIIIKFGNKVRRRREKHSTMSRVFPYTSFALLLLPACFTTEQNIFKASLFVLDNFTFTWIVESGDHPVMFSFFFLIIDFVFAGHCWGGKWADHAQGKESSDWK